ncbi:cupin domain-containing protein [Bradyrhizobium japonicum]|uniref:cupin domain-containing protein n=1 Tax=Bradyrhizobium japonicum TaxID=375 RepID=UPI0004BBF318|nr:cupin domain-containing protein [Bradyrhizobium japonicum]
MMANDRVNADFTQRVVISTETMPWIPSPQAGVERRMLDRIGGEIARATSLVRYAPASSFPAHERSLGEEFLVLSGVFSDEHGDYPVGTYVRNPPLSRHTPRTGPGCTILVKLRQMDPGETDRVVINTASAMWKEGERAGVATLPLCAIPGRETVMLERLRPGTMLEEVDCRAGEEIFMLEGELQDGHGQYGKGTWIRNPPMFRRALGSTHGATYWLKRDHLRPMP